MDWQTLAVLLILALACLYLAGRARASVRGFRGARPGGGCGDACGGCSGEPARDRRGPVAPVRIRSLRDRDPARGSRSPRRAAGSVPKGPEAQRPGRR